MSATAIGTPARDARGDAGTVAIVADSITLSDRSNISAAGWKSPGKAGTIKIVLKGDDGSLRVDGKTPVLAARLKPYAFGISAG